MLNVLRVIGTMSGTSMDGVDLAFVETDGRARIEFGPQGFFAYSEDDRALLRAALAEASAIADRAARPGLVAAAEQLITRRHEEALRAFMRRNGLSSDRIDLIGFHGQTVLHRPEMSLTVQIGRGDELARSLGVDVVHDFRAADVAAGGQGAPLTPAFHRALVEAAGFAAPVLLVNIGGVGNLTYVAPGQDPIACDTGPGNALIDDLMLSRAGAAMDKDGACAAAGHVDEAALARMLNHPYFRQKPPKSLDRNAFSAAPIAHLALADAAATLTAFTAASIAAHLALLPDEVEAIVVCGGGARNPTLLRELADRTRRPVKRAEDCGWSSDAMEAQAFAYLAARSRHGLPLTFPTTTGVGAPTRGGVLARAN